MTKDPQPAPVAGPNTSRPSTGFVIIEDMLTEFGKTGRCRNLERWVGEAKNRLEEFRSQAVGDRAKREADRVEAAYDRAQELVCGIHKGKIKRP